MIKFLSTLAKPKLVLRLIEIQTFSSSVVLLSYQPKSPEIEGNTKWQLGQTISNK
jgi:hypothetical protein